MREKVLFAAIVLILIDATLFGLDNINLSERIEMATITRSAPPALRDRSILFTFRQPTYARYVGIAFDFENFQTIHTFARNEHDIFVLLFTPPEDLVELKYRIVVDGLWMPDPGNPDLVSDHRGNLLSRFSFKLPPKAVLQSPIIQTDGSVEFNVRYAAGSRVFLAGNFSNWEPFMIEMKEVSPGLYRISRRFPPGDYEYCFIAGGARMTDPLNPSFGTDAHGYLASVFTVR